MKYLVHRFHHDAHVKPRNTGKQYISNLKREVLAPASGATDYPVSSETEARRPKPVERPLSASPAVWSSNEP